MLEILSWVAVIMLSGSYFLQALKIHRHKEVRDLSLASYIALACGFSIMLIRAIQEGSMIFAVKQFATLVPCIIIIGQIIIHRDDKWED
jgi:uncharacterized protein with PQ loop repeat